MLKMVSSLNRVNCSMKSVTGGNNSGDDASPLEHFVHPSSRERKRERERENCNENRTKGENLLGEKNRNGRKCVISFRDAQSEFTCQQFEFLRKESGRNEIGQINE